MRPGLKAREGAAGDLQLAGSVDASMRPGLKAREGRTVYQCLAPNIVASMRPGLKAREGVIADISNWVSLAGFNEARA